MKGRGTKRHIFALWLAKVLVVSTRILYKSVLTFVIFDHLFLLALFASVVDFFVGTFQVPDIAFSIF